MRIAGALLLTWPAISLAQNIAVGAYALPNTTSTQNVITVGSDGALWFNEFPGDKIGRITTAGAITEYTLPEGSRNPYWITAGPDGALWFTEPGHIGRITTAGAITIYPLPNVRNYPAGITAGPDGALWFTESSGDIGRITTAGVIGEFDASTPGADLEAITTGPDGALWFTESIGNRILRITTAGVVSSYTVPTAKSGPLDIAPGPDGALWFTEYFTNKIGRITTAGAITEFPVPTAQSGPSWITTGPDGALWFTEDVGNKIGRITTAGAITEYPADPISHDGPGGLTTGPDGQLWFATHPPAIGEAVFVTANLSVSPASGVHRSALGFTGSGYAPHERVRIYVAGVGATVLAAGTADSTGAFTATAVSPESTYGARLFLGVGERSGKLGAASFVMFPELILNPDSGRPGTTVTVEGYGFSSLQNAGLDWDNAATFLGTATTDVHGTFNGAGAFTFTVPAGAAPGAHTVIALGGTFPPIPVSAFFTVQ